MGFIPETVTRRLPSAVTGTLGVDTSGEALGLGIARAGEQVFSRLMAKQAKRKQTLDIISAQAKIREYETSMDEISRVNQGRFKNEPQGGVDQTLNDGETLINSTLQDIKDNTVRAMVAQGLTGSLRRSGNSMKGWAHQQEVVNGAQDFTSVTDADAAKLSQNPDTFLLGEMLVNHNAREEQAKALFGKNWPEAMKKGRQSILKGQITGYELNDPLTGINFLETTDFGGIFDSEEIKGFKKNMRDSFEGRKETKEFEDSVNTLNFFAGADKKFGEGKLTVDEVDDLELALDEEGLLAPENQEEVKKLRKIAAKATNLKSIESTERVLKLYDEINNLQIESDKLTANATLQEIFNFRKNVYDAIDDGVISPEKSTWMLKQIETIKTTGLGQATGVELNFLQTSPFGGGNLFSLFSAPATPEQHGFRKVNAWLEEVNFSENVEAKAKIKILGDLMEAITDIRNSGGTITNEMVDGFVETHFKEELVRQHPAFHNIPPEGKPVRLKSGKKVIMFSNGLSVPIK